MRQRYDSMFADYPLPRLWGLSLLGTSLRVYCDNLIAYAVEPVFEDRPNPGCLLPRNFLEGDSEHRYSFSGRVRQDEGDCWRYYR